MSYLYDSLRDALGGKTFSKGTTMKGWSPNEVRAIFIMRDFILIADYLKQPKIVLLDSNELNMDLSNPTRRGSLNSILENRQLSCMEEIYVDEGYLQYPQVINLEEYIKGMFNQLSRLRYYGYVSGFDSQSLKNIYSNLLINGNDGMNFTIAKNVGGFNYKDTGNNDWYKKYNLRPQFYDIDGDKGRLHTYFSKCEKIIGEEIQNKEKTINSLNKANKIVSMFKVDVERASDILLLNKFINMCKGCDDFVKSVAECLQKSLLKQNIVKGLTLDTFKKSIQLSGIQLTGREKFILELYKKTGVFDTNDGDLENDEYNDGIYQLERRLDEGLSDSLRKCSNKEYVLYYLLASTRNTGGLPKGVLTELMRSKNILMCEETDKGNISGLLRFVYGVCGFIKEDFEKHNK